MTSQAIQDIKQYARQLGACRLVDSITSYETLALALRSPQGVEFLTRHQEPATLLLFRKYRRRLLRYSISVDATHTLRPKSPSCMFIGPSTQAIAHAHGTSQLYTYVVMDGAILTVHASDYAVVRIYNINGHVHVFNDGTAKILQ